MWSYFIKIMLGKHFFYQVNNNKIKIYYQAGTRITQVLIKPYFSPL